MTARQNEKVTKRYLDQKLDRLQTELKTELKAEVKTDLLEIKDEIVEEIQAMREEFNAHQFSHSRIDEDLDHEKRVSKLEVAGTN